MYSLKDLTNIILEVRKTNAQNQELLIKMLEIIEDFYANDTWVICPASHNDNNEHFFGLAETNVGRYLVMLSNEQYYRNAYGTDMIMTSIRKIFDIYFQDNSLDGIIINAGTEAEILLQRQVIEMLELKTK